MTPYKMQNLVYDSYGWVDFSKIGNFVQNLAQNWADWNINGLLFLEKLVFVWVYFQIPWRHIPTKTKLEYPSPRDDCICEALWHRPKQSELGRERDYFLAYNAIFICNSLSIAICFISI